MPHPKKKKNTKELNPPKSSLKITNIEAMINLACTMSFATETQETTSEDSEVSEVSEEVRGLMGVAINNSDRIIVKNNLILIFQYYRENPELLNENFPLDPDNPKEQRIYGTILHAIIHAKCEDLVVDFLNSLFNITTENGAKIIKVNSISADFTKHTPLYYALLSEKYMISKLLVEHGAIINTSNAYGAHYHTSAEFLLNNVAVEQVQKIVEVLSSMNFLSNKHKSATQQLDAFKRSFEENKKKYDAGKFCKKDVYKNDDVIIETVQEADSEGPKIVRIMDKTNGHVVFILDDKILIPEDEIFLYVKGETNYRSKEDAQDITAKHSEQINLEAVIEQDAAAGSLKFGK